MKTASKKLEDFPIWSWGEIIEKMAASVACTGSTKKKKPIDKEKIMKKKVKSKRIQIVLREDLCDYFEKDRELEAIESLPLYVKEVLKEMHRSSMTLKDIIYAGFNKIRIDFRERMK